MSTGGTRDIGSEVAAAEACRARGVSAEGSSVLSALGGGAEDNVPWADRTSMKVTYVFTTCS